MLDIIIDLQYNKFIYELDLYMSYFCRPLVVGSF